MYKYKRTSHVYNTPEEVASWPEGHKRCRECQRILPFRRFHEHKLCLFGYNTICKTCRQPLSQKHYADTSPEYRLWVSARHRAKTKGLPFTIEIGDIVIPRRCPVFGVPMRANTMSAPSLDRIRPSEGYVPGNIAVMSRRANYVKSDATVKELEAVIAFLRKHG